MRRAVGQRRNCVRAAHPEESGHASLEGRSHHGRFGSRAHGDDVATRRRRAPESPSSAVKRAGETVRPGRSSRRVAAARPAVRLTRPLQRPCATMQEPGGAPRARCGVRREDRPRTSGATFRAAVRISSRAPREVPSCGRTSASQLTSARSPPHGRAPRLRRTRRSNARSVVAPARSSSSAAPASLARVDDLHQLTLCLPHLVRPLDAASSRAPTSTILLSGYSTMPCARAAFSRGIRSRDGALLDDRVHGDPRVVAQCRKSSAAAEPAGAPARRPDPPGARSASARRGPALRSPLSAGARGSRSWSASTCPPAPSWFAMS